LNSNNHPKSNIQHRLQPATSHCITPEPQSAKEDHHLSPFTFPVSSFRFFFTSFLQILSSSLKFTQNPKSKIFLPPPSPLLQSLRQPTVQDSSSANPKSKIQHSTSSSIRHSGIAAFQNPKSIEASTLRLPKNFNPTKMNSNVKIRGTAPFHSYLKKMGAAL